MLVVFACFYFDCSFSPGMHIVSMRKIGWGAFKVTIVNNSFFTSSKRIVFSLHYKDKEVQSSADEKLTLHPFERVTFILPVSNQVSDYDSYDIHLKEGRESDGYKEYDSERN